MSGLSGRKSVAVALALVAALLGGCSSKMLNHAPVEDRGTAGGKAAPVAMDPTTQAVKQPPGFENAGKPGYYTVKPGDTLIRIGLETGQSSKDIARWSSLENPNKIEVGQVLRVVPPAAGTARPVAAVTTTPATPASAPVADKAASSAPAPAPAATGSGEDEIAWIWPTNGAVLAGFDEVKNKGLDIGGAAGDPVVAAADGRVVYVGAGLRGYGNLIILKHNNTYLTAYAHNQTLLIKEDQSVRKGQKIAEMGNSDADRVKLHFEVRRQGKPVDPAKYLPAR
ncbi:peptidoglycan DD-metalloendopeptidase family protein [Rhodoferax sp.]|uniref:peptidoglycan DD-metalloendopeptidase family protein n=1 Tax=Rhodoferax sp. TaxID=50421 RepID=UPI0025FA6D27|nr:peptidoglycan DD-metalloendopeptidase family protein [Rhodoferax sp.]